MTDIAWEEAEPFQVYDVYDRSTGTLIYAVMFAFIPTSSYPIGKGGWYASPGAAVWFRWRRFGMGTDFYVDSFGRGGGRYVLRPYSGEKPWYPEEK